jgi:hypothetical protein
MKPDHTPGPWIADENGVILGGLNGLTSIGETYCKAWERTPEHPMREAMLQEAQANARLIAAAPDLLEACKTFLGLWPADRPYHPDVKIAAEMARAAIAKAQPNPNAGAAQAYPAGRWTGGAK